MVIFLTLVIVSAVLAVSGVVVLFALASEAEVLPSFTRAGGVGDEAESEGGRGGISPRSRTRVSLSNQS
jgi:hypothetical protein